MHSSIFDGTNSSQSLYRKRWITNRTDTKIFISTHQPARSLTASEKIEDISKFEKAIEKLFFVLNSALNSILESRNRILIAF